MANYFQKEKKTPFLMKILWWVFAITAIGSAIALMLSYLAPVLNPYTYWYIAFLGLITPILMVINVVCLAVLGIMLKKLALLPLLALVLGIGYVGNFVQVDFMTEYHDAGDKTNNKEFSVMTFNAHHFGQYGSNGKSTLSDILNFTLAKNPDIVCFQEILIRNDKDKNLIDTKLKDWKYQVISYVAGSGNDGWGLAVFSKYPIIDAKEIRFASRSNSAMMLDAVVNKDTIRIFNNHLQSTHFNQLDLQELENGAAELAARKVSSTLRNNYKIRAYQADSMAMFIGQSTFRTVVVGDFNDTPMSYVYNAIRGDMMDTFREKGKGYAYTYRPFKKLFRIDYILHSKGLETLAHDSPETTWSDHKPVIARLKIIQIQD